MKPHEARLAATCLVLLLLAACSGQTPVPTASPPPPTVAPTTAAPTAPPPTAAPTTPPAAPTPLPATVAPTVAPTAVPGLSSADVEKLVNTKFNTVDTNLALWNIQPGLGTVMIEYGNRLARLWFAANAGNWDMAKYQLDEMTEIQEVGETTRPKRAPMLKAFEDNFLTKIDKAIAAKDKTAFTQSFNDAVSGCNACHTASTGTTWKSYQYVQVEVPKTDPAAYIDWKGGGQDNHIATAPAGATGQATGAAGATGQPTGQATAGAAAATGQPTGQAQAAAVASLDAAGIENLINGKFDKVDRSLALWNIQPGLGTVMIEYGNRFSRLFHSAKAGNWDMAKYQLDEMIEIQEVGETTRPSRAPMLKAFEDGFLQPLDKAIAAKDAKAFDTAYAAAVGGCNGCHAGSSGTDWKSYRFVKIQAPTADNNNYLVWNAAKGTGSYIANPAAAGTGTPAAGAAGTGTPAPATTDTAARATAGASTGAAGTPAAGTGTPGVATASGTGTPSPAAGALTMADVEKMVNDKFNKVDRSLALWNIQPGLGTVMIEYGRRFAQLKASIDAGNWDMAKYQLDEMIEIQEVGETTRPSRSPMLKAFEDSFLKPLDTAIVGQDKAKATTAYNSALAGCNGCHVASKGTNWNSYAYVQIQAPPTDPADYLQWKASHGTGNYIAPAAGGTPVAGATSAGAGGGTGTPAAGTSGATPSTTGAGTETPAAGASAGTPSATSGATPAGGAATAGGPPKVPADHAGRTQCLVCHAVGAAGPAPKVPTSNPDHTAFKDDNNAAICLTCHTMTK